MSYNNYYNFKNTIRHFINIDNLIYPPNISTLNIDDTSWTTPLKFRIQKDEHSFRTLKIPNILQFALAYEQIKGLPNFSSIENLDIQHKRLIPNVDTGDFKIGSYDSAIEADFDKLCVYDNLLRLDIKEFYGRIYTHYLDFSGLTDRYLTNLNMGATNGIIMGNYLSLYFAEQQLSLISCKIKDYITAEDISCEYSYFSDDFYFFCNKYDNNRIIEIFDKVLEEFDLCRNTDKLQIYNYQSYNQNNLMERYWKKINYYCNTHFSESHDNNHLAFINQLIYRSSMLDNEKDKRIFINNFLKGKYFHEIDTSKYEFRDYDYHQLCYLLRTSPESMLYCFDIFSAISNFEKEKLHKFFEVRYKDALSHSTHDVQIYYFYAIEFLKFYDLINEFSGNVIESENQVLISYYLINHYFEASHISQLKQLRNEKYWFQNYHLILTCPDLLSNIDFAIEQYLIPNTIRPVLNEKSSASTRRYTYSYFYKTNLQAGNKLINTIADVQTEISDYLDLRFTEEQLLYI